MDLVDALSLPIERLEFVVTDGPGAGFAAVVRELTEVLFPEADQGRPVELGVTAHPVMDTWVKLLPVLVEPGFVRLVAGFSVHGRGAPVFLLPWQKAASFEDQDLLPGRSEGASQCTAARTGTNDDDVVVVHGRGLRRTRPAVTDVTNTIEARSARDAGFVHTGGDRVGGKRP
jgi:hypothetical protein